MQWTTTNGDDGGGDRGFTLIELMVVVVVLGVLLAVGIPTLLGARHRAQNTAAKSRVMDALKAQKTYASDAKQQYTTNTSVLNAIEPSVTFDTNYTDALGSSAPAAVLGRVYIRDAAGSTVTLVSRSAAGKCYWTHDDSGETTYLVNDCSEPDMTAFGSSWDG